MSYEGILNRTWGEIPEPQTLPEGSYVVRIVSMKLNEATETQKETVGVILKPEEVMDDVDSEDLAALGDNYDIASNTIFDRIFTEDGGWEKVRNLLKKAGTYDAAQSIPESFKAAVGSKVVAFLKVREYTDKQSGEDRVVNNVGAYASLEG